jgi:hypothetical protein
LFPLGPRWASISEHDFSTRKKDAPPGYNDGASVVGRWHPLHTVRPWRLEAERLINNRLQVRQLGQLLRLDLDVECCAGSNTIKLRAKTSIRIGPHDQIEHRVRKGSPGGV